MPYNTRRKSLSLPSLGIHLPSSSRRSPSISKSHDDQPSKKVKRSHDSLSISPEPQLAPQHHLHHQQHHRPSARRAAWEHTPPPSPLHGHGGSDGDNSSLSPVPPKIDTEGINDDIVVAVIRQLEATHNRPHLVKELAAVLVSLNDTVANSANPAALLSSRLSSYMKRSWSALAPCPIGKELILIHPRKVYYYLTTMARQPLPENSDDLVIPGQQISPSATLDKRGGQQSTQDHDNAEDEEEEEDDDDDNDAISFRQRSSSPEVDLSSPDFEEDEHNINSLTGRPGATRTTHGFDDPHSSSMRMMHSHRAVSPPLEGDEKEFTQTASAVRERASEQQKASQQLELSNARSAISEGLSQLDMHDSSSASSAVSSSASSSRSSSSAAAAGANNNNNCTNNYNNSYDYFAHNDEHHHHHHKLHEQLVEHDSDAAACALLGTSPSPSLTSVASSLSSSAPSVAGLDSEEERAPRISLPEDPSVTHVSPLKRSIDMLNSGLSDADIDINMADLADHEDKVAIKTAAAPASAATIGTMNVDHSYDSSWRELQNPETVEVDELDEMFGEI